MFPKEQKNDILNPRLLNRTHLRTGKTSSRLRSNINIPSAIGYSKTIQSVSEDFAGFKPDIKPSATAEYPVGKLVYVYYNQDDPKNSCLERWKDFSIIFNCLV